MYAEKEETSIKMPKDGRPAFGRILDALKEQRCISMENSMALKKLASCLEPLDATPVREDGLSKEPSSLLEYLWAEIRLIQASNEETIHVVRHLSKIIGE